MASRNVAAAILFIAFLGVTVTTSVDARALQEVWSNSARSLWDGCIRFRMQLAWLEYCSWPTLKDSQASRGCNSLLFCSRLLHLTITIFKFPSTFGCVQYQLKSINLLSFIISSVANCHLYFFIFCMSYEFCNKLWKQSTFSFKANMTRTNGQK